MCLQQPAHRRAHDRKSSKIWHPGVDAKPRLTTSRGNGAVVAVDANSTGAAANRRPDEGEGAAPGARCKCAARGLEPGHPTGHHSHRLTHDAAGLGRVPRQMVSPTVKSEVSRNVGVISQVPPVNRLRERPAQQRGHARGRHPGASGEPRQPHHQKCLGDVRTGWLVLSSTTAAARCASA